MTGNARIGGRVARIGTAAALCLLAYPVAGLIGGAIPANTGWRAPAEGVTIWVESNGIHTGIVMPKQAIGVDWRRTFPAGDLADPRYGGFGYVAVGWGEKRFYLGTPTWRDVRPATVLAAAIGSDATLVHVDHIPLPASSDDARRVVLRADEYRRLAAYIQAQVVPGGRKYRGYDRYDAFYEARGHYSAIHTCNAWTGEALRQAGVRVGAWTPFPSTVLGWF